MVSEKQRQIDPEAVERASKALYDLWNACVELGRNMGEAIEKVFSDIDFSGLTDALAPILAAYEEAKKEHPQWAHRAKYSKKKRVRKKYFDRIMREYYGRRCNE